MTGGYLNYPSFINGIRTLGFQQTPPNSLNRVSVNYILEKYQESFKKIFKTT